MKSIFSLFDPDKDKLAKEKKLKSPEQSELDELIDFVKDQYQNHPLKGEEQMKRAYNKAFVEGYHYMRRDFNSNKLQIEKSDKSKGAVKTRSKLNYVRRNRKIAIAKIMKDEPVLNAIPNSGSTNDIKAARVARAILENAFSQNEIDLTGKTYDVLQHAYTYGTGWWKITWNPLLMDGKGNFQISVHDDFEIYADPSARDWFSMEWVIHAYLQDIPKLEFLYKNLKGKIHSWGSDENSQNRELFTLDFFSENQNVYKNKAFVLEFVARNCPRWPKGKKLVLINMELPAKYGNNPFSKFGSFFSMNFIPFIWEPNPGKLLGMNAVDDQVPINKEIDKIGSITMENIKKTAAIKIGLPRGSSKAGDIIGDKSHIFYYNSDGGGKPIGFQPPAMPTYVSSYMSFLVGAQQDMAGIHEVSQGQLPERGSQMSGSALKLLQDSEQVQQSPVMRKLKGSLEIAGQFILLVSQNYYIEERFLTLMGRNKRHEILAFIGADLNGSFDVRLTIGSAFNTSAAAKIEGLLALWKEGIIQEAEKGSKAARKVLAALEFGQIEDIYQLEAAQEARAEMVLDIIVQQRKVPKIYDWENMDIYINVWREMMLSGDYMEKDDDLQRILEDQMRWFIEMKKGQAQAQPGQDQMALPSGKPALSMQSEADEQAQMMAEGPGIQGGEGVEIQQEVMS